MRIAYITETYPPELNGVALTVKRTVEFLRGQGHDVELIRPRQPGEAHVDDATEWRTASLAIPVYRDLRMGLAWVSSCRSRFERTKPRLVHIATEGPLGWAAARAARSLGITVSSDFRTNFHQYSRYYGIGFLEPLTRGYLRRFHNATAATFVPTERLRGELAAQGFENLKVVGRGVDTEQFNPAWRDPALRAEWGAADDAPVVLYVGRVAPEKNIPLLFKAFEAIRRVRPDARLVIAGDGPLRPALEAGHPEVRFVGSLRGEALARCYASADLFVFPSLSETFGNVVIEALSAGLAVVAFNCAAAGDLIRDRVNGVLVEPGDDARFVEAACSTAEQVGRQPELHALREGARAVAVATGWDSVLQRFDQFLSYIANENQKSDEPGALLAQRPL